MNNIRWMIRRDMANVLAIEGQSEDPWSERDFLDQLRQRNCIGMIIEDPLGDDLYGFMVYELHRRRLHILKLGVRESMQRRGIGSDLMQKLKSKLSNDRRTDICVDVPEGNLGAQLFFQANGFKAVRVDDGAYRMKYSVVTSGYVPKNRITGYLSF